MLLLGVVAIVLVLATALAAVAGLLRARVAAAAAALAAAPVTFLPFGATGTPAEEAAQFARLNGTELVWCSCPVDRSWAPRVVAVEVARRSVVWPIGAIRVTARSRAEFVPARLLDAG